MSMKTKGKSQKGYRGKLVPPPMLHQHCRRSQEILGVSFKYMSIKMIQIIPFKKISHTHRLKKWDGALAGVAQWIECHSVNLRVAIRFLVRAHAWVVGQVPSRGHMRGNHTLMFLSLSFFLPFLLFKNK